MAPIYIALGAWEAAELPGAAVFSLVTLLIITITLLTLCSRCQKHSFDLEHDIPRERNSDLVVQLENITMSVDNPTAADMTKDEKYLSSLPVDVAVKPAGEREFRPWRSHTLDRDPQRMINGGNRHDLNTLNLNPNPAASEPPLTETSLRSADQTVSTHKEYELSMPASEPHGFQTISLDEDTNYDIIQRPHSTTQHIYETTEHMKGPDVSLSTGQRETLPNPYATYDSIKTNGPQGDGSYMPAPPVLAEELDEGLGGGNISDQYARVSKKKKHSSPPVEPPLENEAEVGVPPLPQRS
ncbi:uncharacterized protein [Salminus brasiliensis]|uniref:uncharacterized protein isoform X1 n=1 Tax=Salminus brasiliensis TaxID=930266 RepID=UPI003B832835